MDNVLLVVPAADDNILHPGKGGLAVSNSPVHMPLEGRPAFLRPKGIRLYSNRPKGVVMAVFCTSAGFTGIWWYPFLKSILEKTVQPAALAAKSSMLGSGYTSGSVTRFNRLKSPHGRQLPSAFLTMCKGLDQGDVER